MRAHMGMLVGAIRTAAGRLDLRNTLPIHELLRATRPIRPMPANGACDTRREASELRTAQFSAGCRRCLSPRLSAPKGPNRTPLGGGGGRANHDPGGYAQNRSRIRVRP